MSPDDEKLSIRVDPGADPLVLPFEFDGRLLVLVGVHVGRVLVAGCLEHAANCAAHQSVIVDRLVHELFVDDVPRFPERCEELVEIVRSVLRRRRGREGNVRWMRHHGLNGGAQARSACAGRQPAGEEDHSEEQRDRSPQHKSKQLAH
jgi:hypothetical protein